MNGVKQACVLAQWLFRIFFAVVFKIALKININGIYIRYRSSDNIFIKTSKRGFTDVMQELLYADDCDLVTHTKDEVQNLMDCFSGSCASFGLTINVNKTLFIYQPDPNKDFVDLAIFVYGKRLKVLVHFVYLDSKLSQDNSLIWEISFRLQKATRSFALLKKRHWSQFSSSISSKLGEIRVCVHTALLCVGETWAENKRRLRTL